MLTRENYCLLNISAISSDDEVILARVKFVDLSEIQFIELLKGPGIIYSNLLPIFGLYHVIYNCRAAVAKIQMKGSPASTSTVSLVLPKPKQPKAIIKQV